MFVVRLEKLLSQMPLDMKEQTSDIFRLSLPEYFIKWTAKVNLIYSQLNALPLEEFRWSFWHLKST